MGRRLGPLLDILLVEMLLVDVRMDGRASAEPGRKSYEHLSMPPS